MDPKRRAEKAESKHAALAEELARLLELVPASTEEKLERNDEGFVFERRIVPEMIRWRRPNFDVSAKPCSGSSGDSSPCSSRSRTEKAAGGSGSRRRPLASQIVSEPVHRVCGKLWTGALRRRP